MTAVTKIARAAYLTDVSFSLKRMYENITMNTELTEMIAPTMPPLSPASNVCLKEIVNPEAPSSSSEPPKATKNKIGQLIR